MRGSSSEVSSTELAALSSASASSPSKPAPKGLVFVSDDLPGFSRVRRGKRFRYRDVHSRWLQDRDEIQRIDRLAIPPAYTDVWICPLKNGHMQATGRDARGRKQYRYHADWRMHRDETKFERLEAFGLALPRIRANVTRDLIPAKGQPLGRTVVLATLVRLLDTTFVRVGNDEYARENGSFGLTTLRAPHAGVRGSLLRLKFRGKSGVMQDVTLDDPRVAAVVRRCQQLPGQALFQYLDDPGEARTLDSSEVNDYLAQISAGPRTGERGGGERFTAKDFRTWHGTVQALELTRRGCTETPATADTAPAAFNAKAMLAEVAGLLGNTPAVCRKSYIHPAVMALGGVLASDAGAMADLWHLLEASKPPRRLRLAEARLLAFLKLERQTKKASRPAGVKSVKRPTTDTPRKK